MDIIQFSMAVQTHRKSWQRQKEVDVEVGTFALQVHKGGSVGLDTYVKFATLAILDQVTQRAVCPLLDSVPNHIIHFQ